MNAVAHFMGKTQSISTPSLYLLSRRVPRSIISTRSFSKLKEESKFKPSIRSMMKEYGASFLVYWTAVWVGTGFTTYGVVTYAGPDVALSAIKKLGVDTDAWDINPNHVNIGVAVAINEMIEPIRFPICVATTPAVVRFIKNVMKR
eukprot:CFRG7359T1